MYSDRDAYNSIIHYVPELLEPTLGVMCLVILNAAVPFIYVFARAYCMQSEE